MQHLKNIGVGFLVSFVGSIPLGYLNVIGFEIYRSTGISNVISYLLGVVCIEFLVIYLTLVFANALAANVKLLKFIEVFSILFMFFLAYLFFSGAHSDPNNATVFVTVSQNFFLAGICYSCLNFIQIPFWLSWNLYLLNANYIEVSKFKKYFYLLGTSFGTFCGMLALILLLHHFTGTIDFLSKYLMKIIIPLVFTGLGVLQAVKLGRKQYR